MMKVSHVFVIILLITACTFTVHEAAAVPVQERNEENKAGLEQDKIQNINDANGCCPSLLCRLQLCKPHECC